MTIKVLKEALHRSVKPRFTLCERNFTTEVSLRKHCKCLRNLKAQQLPAIFRICVWEKLGQGNHVIVVTSSIQFSKSFVFKRFASTRKRKVGVFKFLRMEERIRKAPFSWLISVDGSPNRRKKSCVFKFLQPVYVHCRYLNEHLQWSYIHGACAIKM